PAEYYRPRSSVISRPSLRWLLHKPPHLLAEGTQLAKLILNHPERLRAHAALGLYLSPLQPLQLCAQRAQFFVPPRQQLLRTGNSSAQRFHLAQRHPLGLELPTQTLNLSLTGLERLRKYGHLGAQLT